MKYRDDDDCSGLIVVSIEHDDMHDEHHSRCCQQRKLEDDDHEEIWRENWAVHYKRKSDALSQNEVHNGSLSTISTYLTLRRAAA